MVNIILLLRCRVRNEMLIKKLKRVSVHKILENDIFLEQQYQIKKDFFHEILAKICHHGLVNTCLTTFWHLESDPVFKVKRLYI